jgi:hypothetical protein
MREPVRGEGPRAQGPPALQPMQGRRDPGLSVLVAVLAVVATATGLWGEAATTPVTEALDIAIIVPATLIAGGLLLRGRVALGTVIAVPLLTLLVALTPVIAAQTVAQLAAGINATTAEIVGPISGFLVLGGTAGFLVVKVLRAVRATD